MDEVDLIIEAISKDDAATLDALLRANPQHRFRYNGSERWLTSAVMHGRVNVLKLLVSLGANPAAPENTTDSVPDPEGPIFHAACAGHLEMVRYLLDLGVPVNHIIDDRVRCSALAAAARYGYLDLTKLLVKHGAAVNAIWADKTPLDNAMRAGEDDVAEYLRSVGAKPAAELAAGG